MSRVGDQRDRQLDVIETNQRAMIQALDRQGKALERQGRALEELLRRSTEQPIFPRHKDWSKQMSKDVKHLGVFVASPSDVAEERKILESVITEINLTSRDAHNIHLDLIKWETHVRPGFGGDTQEVVTRQIGHDYDIFLGIMWGRFGSPTQHAESGTEEEFNQALSRWKDSQESVEIMFYFKDAGIPPSKQNPEQLAKVQAFKEQISSQGGLYHVFEDAEEFRTKVRSHLTMAAQDWRNKPVSDPETEMPTAPPAAASSSESTALLTNLIAVSDEDDDEGVFELMERATDAMEVVGDVGQKITETITELGKKSERRGEEVGRLSSDGAQPDRKAITRMANNSAGDFEMYVQRMSVEIPRFHEQHSIVMEALEKTAIILQSDTDDNFKDEDIEKTIEGLQEYRTSFATASNSLLEMRETIARLPRMTTRFNHARRRSAAVTDDLVEQFRIAGNQIEDIIELLRHLIGGNGSAQ